jgi:hypothetical protein
MHMDAPAGIEIRWGEVPHRAVQLLGRESNCRHGVKKVLPVNLALTVMASLGFLSPSICRLVCPGWYARMGMGLEHG